MPRSERAAPPRPQARVSSRALVYLFAPVVIASLTLYALVLLESGKAPSVRDLVDWPRVVLAGYFFMGTQSAVFALVMWRLDPRSRAVRLLAGAVLGALLGATMGVFFPRGQWLGAGLGAFAGVASAALASLLGGARA